MPLIIKTLYIVLNVLRNGKMTADYGAHLLQGIKDILKEELISPVSQDTPLQSLRFWRPVINFHPTPTYFAYISSVFNFPSFFQRPLTGVFTVGDSSSTSLYCPITNWNTCRQTSRWQGSTQEVLSNMRLSPPCSPTHKAADSNASPPPLTRSGAHMHLLQSIPTPAKHKVHRNTVLLLLPLIKGSGLKTLTLRRQIPTNQL